MNKRFVLKSLVLAAAALSTGLSLAQDKPLKIGVTAGPHAQIMEQVKKVAEKDGLKIQIVEFSDYIQPNAALASGDLDGTLVLWDTNGWGAWSTTRGHDIILALAFSSDGAQLVLGGEGSVELWDVPGAR